MRTLSSVNVNSCCQHPSKIEQMHVRKRKQERGEGELKRRTAEIHIAKVLELAGSIIADATRGLKRAEIFHKINVVAVGQGAIAI